MATPTAVVAQSPLPRVGPVVREIDVLVALIEAEVPVAAWAAVDEPMDRYRAAISELLDAWESQRSVHRQVATLGELESTRREQRRQLDALRGAQRTLLAELQTALLTFAAARPGVFDDPRQIDDALLWLETRVASHAAERVRAGHLHPLPFPQTLLPGSAASVTVRPALEPPSEPRSEPAPEPSLESALRSALAPHRRAYVNAAEAVVSAWAAIAPGTPQFDREGREDPRLVEAKRVGEPEHEAAVIALAHVVAAGHRDALVALDRLDASDLGLRLAAELTMSSDHDDAMAVARAMAPALPGLDDDARARLRAAAERVAEFDREQMRQRQQALLRSVETGRAPHRDDQPAAVRQAIADGWSRVGREILGERHNELIRAVWSRPNVDDALAELLDDESLEEARSLPLPRWQMRQLTPLPTGIARYRSLTAAGHVSDRLRQRVRDLTGGDAERTTAINRAIGENDVFWIESIAPIQSTIAGIIAHFGQISADEDSLRSVSTVTNSLQSLRLAIGNAERKLAMAVRGASASAYDAERWILDRSIELYAPPGGHDPQAVMPMAAMPQTVDEVITRAGLAPADADAAWGVAVVHVDALVNAAIERQARLEGFRIWRTRREVAFRRMMRFGTRDPLSAGLADELHALSDRLGLHLESMDAPLIDAWEALHRDWSVGLSRHAGPLREAWLVGLMPSLHIETVPTGALIDRLGAALPPDDPRATALAALVAAHRHERERRIATTAEAAMRLPQSVAFYQLSFQRLLDPNPRGNALRRAQFDDTESGVRALRRAIAIVGVEEAMGDTAIAGALAWIPRQR